ncbi:MAG: (2Fe-2S)-binding protein [Rubrivivax sp.]|nr:(2Fe-2S)-binding protein [Rubrivivax sp.]
MFKRSEQAGAGRAVAFRLAGQAVKAREGDSVAAAMLATGLARCRSTPVSGAPRGPYCLMGVCFECLVQIDGVGNQQACLVPVREGMVVELQQGMRALDDAAVSRGGPR